MDLILTTPSGKEFTPSCWLCEMVANYGASSKEWKTIEALMLAGF